MGLAGLFLVLLEPEWSARTFICKPYGIPEGLLFHSDRGSEYTCREFRDLIDRCSVLQSFSVKGYPYDNSVCESFFKYLKMEETDRKHYRTREELRLDLFSYIDGYCNSKRIHSSIGYKTPNEIEKEFFLNYG